MTISIVMPVYNVEGYFVECIESIIKQTYQDYELIIVEDCSTDGTKTLVRNYSDKYPWIEVVCNEENKGAAWCRNLGLKKARGQYIVFLDGDDILDSQYLEKMYLAISKNDADVATCQYEVLGKPNTGNSKITYDYFLDLRNNVLVEPLKEKFLFERFVFSPWNKIIRIKFIKDNGIEFQSLPNANDVYFGLMVMSLAQKIVFVNEVLFYYRQMRPGSLSTHRDGRHNYIFDAYKKYVDEMIVRGKWSGIVKQSFVNFVVDNTYGKLLGYNEPAYTKMRTEFIEFIELYYSKAEMQKMLFSVYFNRMYRAICDNLVEKYDTYSVFATEIKDYICQKNNKKIALWGAGNLGHQLLSLYANEKNPFVAVFDNDKQKQGTHIQGIPIISWEDHPKDLDEIIVLNPRFLNDVTEQVNGICKIADFTKWMRYGEEI